VGGTTGSCHRASTANLTKDNFFDFHNLPNKIADRQSMLHGHWPGNGCEYCKDVEESGGFSDRQFQLTVPNIYPHELDTDPTLTSVKPAILEVFFQNTCNLKCVYCGEKYSSSIEKETKTFGHIPISGKSATLEENKYAELIPLFWQWLEHNYSSLQRINVLGGEPLIQADFEKLLDFINDHPGSLSELCFTTNLIVKEKRFKDCLDKLRDLLKNKKVKRIDILASADSWGPAQEYVRNGFDSQLFENNFRTLLQYPFRAAILTTVNSLSIHEMPALYDKIEEWRKIGKVYWYPNLVTPKDTHALRANIFNPSVWKDSLSNLYNRLPGGTFDNDATKKIIHGIMAYLDTGSDNLLEQDTLRNTLTELDRRRGTNWKKTFNWLDTDNVV
jgi:organic radical activating enzyme